MKKKYYSPSISLHCIVEAETILAGSKPKFKPDVDKSEVLPDEELDGETFDSDDVSTSVMP